MNELLPDLLADLTAHADAADGESDWPHESWQAVVRSGVLAWSVPHAAGGQERSGLELLELYEQLASACLTTAFVLSQREAAVRRLRDAEAIDLLRPLACGGRLATVGISHLSTSAQHLAPIMRATAVEGGYQLDGLLPWVTAASEAQHVIAGATLPDGGQLLLAVDTDSPGVQVGPPMPLMALAGSRTTEVRCERAFVPERLRVAGPTEKVLAGSSSGPGGLETSCLALGLARAALDDLTAASGARPEIRATLDPLATERADLWAELLRLHRDGGTPDDGHALRGRANSLVLRATQAALLFAKGAGFVRPHPAQRWARQALFFLVWSCPRPAQQATLTALTR